MELLIAESENGVKVSIASASRTASLIIERLGISEYIDYIADPTEAVHSKPYPAIFELAGKCFELSPSECIRFEDSAADGVSIRDAGSFPIEIGVDGSDHYLPSTTEIKFDEIKGLI